MTVQTKWTWFWVGLVFVGLSVFAGKRMSDEEAKPKERARLREIREYTLLARLDEAGEVKTVSRLHDFRTLDLDGVKGLRIWSCTIDDELIEKLRTSRLESVALQHYSTFTGHDQSCLRTEIAQVPASGRLPCDMRFAETTRN